MFFRRYILLTLLVLLPAFSVLMAGFGPSAARAEELQPLPELSKEFDLNRYATLTETVNKEFSEIPDLSFQISLPRSWLERMALGQAYGEIARFDGPAFGDVRPYFSFKRMAVPRDNTARLELITYLIKQGFVLRSLKEVDERNVEAVYVVADINGDSFVVRAVARIMGADMMVAEYGIPVQAWERMRDEQTFAMNSFKFLKDNADTIEKRIERTYFNAFRFYYPGSWVFEGEQVPTDNRVTLKFSTINEHNLVSGRIRITVVSPRSLKDVDDTGKYEVDMPALLKEVRKLYEDQGFDLGKAIESAKPDLNMPTSFAVREVYNLRKRETRYETDRKAPVSEELWISVFRGVGAEPKAYIVELFTPSRGQDLYLWGVNTRAYGIILKSMQ